MRFKKGRKNLSLLAMLACVLTATVAFAAYTGYNYIQGTVEVVGNPFKMVYAEARFDEDNQLTAVGDPLDAGDILSSDSTGFVSDVTIEVDETGAYGLNLGTITVNKDSAVYSEGAALRCAITNVGGSTAYLQKITIPEIEAWPTDGANEPIEDGLMRIIQLITTDKSQVCATVAKDAEGLIVTPTEDEQQQMLVVNPGESVILGVMILIGPAMGSSYDADNSSFGATISLGKISVEWSAVPTIQSADT